ncbi:sciellin isoform X3 [Sciurus carolinensis]|uniref:sciellin isoform X3 n=1 Tax=Sciurus carolinensis TaxID=30640 RepID=UPI001FB26EF9|nr:sciellin isoform X3 [Sciurus carolinensis]
MENSRSLLEGSMSNFPSRKKSPTGNDVKSTTGGTTPRQQGFHEVNKRRAFLQDNSWIKKRLEEEKDENYGRVVLNRHNSHDALDRKINERDGPKATISRYRSDDTLDRQPGVLSSANTTYTSASTSATTPVKKKRQSWFPPPPPGFSATPSTEANRRDPTVHPPIPPKPRSPVPSPNQLRPDNRQKCPPKPGVYTEISRSAERNIRSQDRKKIIRMTITSLGKTDKGEELDKLIKMNKSLNRNQGLDGLFRANPKAEQTEKRAKSLESLIYVNTLMDKDGKGNQTLDSFIKENPRAVKNDKGSQDFQSIIKAIAMTDKTSKGGEDLENIIKVNPKGKESISRKQDLNGLIKVNPETNKNIKRGQSLENLIKVTLEVNRSNQGSKDLNNLIEVSPSTGRSIQGGQSLDNLIKVVPETNRIKAGNQDLDKLIKEPPSANKSEQGLDQLINVSPKAVKSTSGNQDLDKLIKVNPEILTTNQRNQDLDNFIKVTPTVIRSNQSQNLDHLINVKPSTLGNSNGDQDPENLMEVNSHVSEKKNGRLGGQVNGFTNALHNESTRTTAYSYETRNSFSSNAGTRHSRPKDTVVYTRTYVEKSKLPKSGYQETMSGKYIQTVYSTSDRSVIERDMCTYCRKPLGIETKMILDELQICCHSTCFKCEICKQPLENLQAGDSIWIYRQTIHCEPCYSKVLAKWTQ